MAEKMKKGDIDTPLMKQYYSFKAQYPNAILLFRVGDFYETFSDDAILASEILGIVLTKRGHGSATAVELAGFPHHALDIYLPKLVKAGHKVAICDQLEDPKLAKTLVKRGVTELITPAVSYNENTYDNKSNNFLAGVHIGDGDVTGIALLDVSTGEFYATSGNKEYINTILHNFSPKEIVIQKKHKSTFTQLFDSKAYISTFDDWVFTYDYGYEELTTLFDTGNLKGFGVEDMPEAVTAAGGIIHYLKSTNHDKLNHITSISRLDKQGHVWLDKFTIANLELTDSQHENAKTLLTVLDRTQSPMGGRLLRRWILTPLSNIEKINFRLQIVNYLVNHDDITGTLRQKTASVGDMERISGKIATGRVLPRELVNLKNALIATNFIQETCAHTDCEELKTITKDIDTCAGVIETINKTIKDEPAVSIDKAGVIRDGVNKELDELRNLTTSSRDYLQQIQMRESKKTGIPSLKIGFTNVFGYYIEVTNSHKDKVPPDWIRKQTLVNAERYVTEELKMLEDKILNSEERIANIERKIYFELISELQNYIQPIQINSHILATMDCLSGFAVVAKENGYTMPEVNAGHALQITAGRHPVIERQLPIGESYIANDIYLDRDTQQIMMITGPNMSGKSALLRQTALIVIMAQIGSFVPARQAVIGLIDKIFTRVGASDNISSGESTFMVEMNETSSILNNISDRSLILMDEIGRGTSTFDGISIAWAVAEYLHDNKAFHPKVLFATHYHELNEMAKYKERIKNYHVTVKEAGNKIIFLRKLAAGGTEHSFGIHVAKMAGMPLTIIKRANEILKQLEKSQINNLNKEEKKENTPHVGGTQISLIQMEDPLLTEIKQDILNIDINTLTPVEALMKLNEIKKLLIKL